MSNYKRPNKTYQDTLGEKEIRELLKDYTSVTDIFTVPINTHIRYFTIDKNGKKHFRLGGNIFKSEKKKGYVVLTNGKVNWSVQDKNTIFFKKLSIDDIKEKYDAKLTKYKQKIKTLEKSLEEIKQKLTDKTKK